jgi:hypothetical protein
MACADRASEPSSSRPPTAEPGIVLSAPVPRLVIPTEDGSGSLVFVAATPATVPGALRVLVKGADGDSAVAHAHDGGFDPLPIRAGEGQVVTVSIFDSSGAVTSTQTAAARRPPRVVRTSPAAYRTDVPLNMRLAVIFTSPMDAASAAAGVGLRTNGASVRGEVIVAPGGLAVEFVPADPLVATADYELIVEESVRDALGANLERSVRVPFRTGATSAAVRFVTIGGYRYPWFGAFKDFQRLAVGDSVGVYAVANGFFWDGLVGLTARWSSSDPTVVQVVAPESTQGPGLALLRALRPGQVTLRVELGGVVTERQVSVYGPIPADRVSGILLDVANGANGYLFRMRPDGSDATLLVNAWAELPDDNTDCAPFGWGSSDCYNPVHEFAVAPDGAIAITRASEDGSVWVKAGAEGAMRRITSDGDRGAAYHPAWSPDGGRLAYWFDLAPQGSAELRVVNADGSGQRVLRRVSYDPRQLEWAERPFGGSEFLWHPDGTRLLVASEQGTLQVATDGSGSSVYLAGFQPGPWFPDGRTQFVTEQARGVTRVYRADASGRVDLASAISSLVPVAVSPDGRLLLGQDRSLYSADLTSYLPLRIAGSISFAP